MSDRRKEERDDASDRRRSPRPPIVLTLSLIAFAVALGMFAWFHRQKINQDFEQIVVTNQSVSDEVAELRQELLRANLTEEQLRRELEARLAAADSLRSDEFHISLHPDEQVMRLNYGGAVVREAPLTVGKPLTVSGPDGSWTFAEFRGATHVSRKLRNQSWKPEAWVYRLNGQDTPAERPAVANGLGQYVIEMPNGYIIHSPPPEDSPLKGPKPASFMVPEEDLAAIWDRVEEDMNVHVF